MKERRLLKLATLLEKNARTKKGICFDMGIWGEVEDPKKPLSCGTRACAMGLAGLSGAFKRQGLKCKIKTNGGFSSISIGFGRRWDEINAAQRLFEITGAQANYLFVSHMHLDEAMGAAGERSAAKRIRRFVASSGKTPP